LAAVAGGSKEVLPLRCASSRPPICTNQTAAPLRLARRRARLEGALLASCALTGCEGDSIC
jgi:hypothetical protein